MSGVSMTAIFEDGPIRKHLAMLAITHANGFDDARRSIGSYMVDETRDNIRNQKLFDGTAMPQSKRAIERKGKTLLDKGNLRDSYTYNLTRGGLEIGSAKVYAAIHHFGGPAKAWGKHAFTMTPRPVLGMNSEHESMIGQFLIDEIKKAQR